MGMWHVSLYREWKWHLGEKRSGNPLTSVKSAFICWCTAANLLTSIPESCVVVKEKEVRVAGPCDSESRRAFTPASRLFPKHCLLTFVAHYSASEKNPLTRVFSSYCSCLLCKQVPNVQKCGATFTPATYYGRLWEHSHPVFYYSL